MCTYAATTLSPVKVTTNWCQVGLEIVSSPKKAHFSRREYDCPRVQHCPGPLWLTKGVTHIQWCPAAGLSVGTTQKNPQRKLRPMGTSEGAHRRYTYKEWVRSQGWRGRPSRVWNEPNGTENVSSRWTRPSPTSPPNFNKVPFQPRDMEATGPRKGLEGCCDCGEHINFSNLSSNIKASGFIFQRRLTTILVPFQSHVQKADLNRFGPVKQSYFKVHLNSHILGIMVKDTAWYIIFGRIKTSCWQSCFPEHSTKLCSERLMMENSSSFCAPLPPTTQGIL